MKFLVWLKEKNNKLYFGSLIVALLSPIFVNVGMNILSIASMGGPDAWTAFWGNYLGSILGGIIGGLIAVFVVYIQFDEQKKVRQKDKYESQLPTLTKLIKDLEIILPFLRILQNTAKSQFVNNEIGFDQFSLVHFQDVRRLTQEYWLNLDTIIDLNLLSEIVKFHYDYNSICEVLTFNCNEIASKLNNIDLDIKEFMLIEQPTDRDRQNLADLNTSKMPLVNLYNQMCNSKRNIWRSILSDEFLLRPESLYKTLKGLSEQISFSIANN